MFHVENELLVKTTRENLATAENCYKELVQLTDDAAEKTRLQNECKNMKEEFTRMMGQSLLPANFDNKAVELSTKISVLKKTIEEKKRIADEQKRMAEERQVIFAKNTLTQIINDFFALRASVSNNGDFLDEALKVMTQLQNLNDLTSIRSLHSQYTQKITELKLEKMKMNIEEQKSALTEKVKNLARIAPEMKPYTDQLLREIPQAKTSISFSLSWGLFPKPATMKDLEYISEEMKRLYKEVDGHIKKKEEANQVLSRSFSINNG